MKMISSGALFGAQTKQMEDKGFHFGTIQKQETLKQGERSGNSIFAGSQQEDSQVEQRKALVKKQAMKLVRDTFEGDASLDDTIREANDRKASYQEEVRQATEQLASLKEARNEVEKVGANEDISKMRDKYDELESYYKKAIKNASSAAMAESHMVEGIHMERLKADPMQKTADMAEGMLEEASKSAISGFFDEAKDAIDQDLQDDKDKYEKLQEKKQKEEEQASENKVSDSKASSKQVSDTANQAEQKNDQVKQKIKKLLDDQKVLEEDLKGIAVDGTV